jgi:hypothetical protein
VRFRVRRGDMMKVKTSVLLAVLGVCLLGTLVGCDQPNAGGKRPAAAPAPGPAPANTTEAK